jgi:hypothetical protein
MLATLLVKIMGMFLITRVQSWEPLESCAVGVNWEKEGGPNYMILNWFVFPDTKNVQNLLPLILF